MGTTIDYCVCCGSSDLTSNPALWMPFVAEKALGLPPLRITKEMGFRTIEEGIGYAMCKSLHCRACGHLFADYRFNDAEMAKLYDDYRGSYYTRLRNFYEPGYKIRNNVLSNGNSYPSIVHGFLANLLPQRSFILDWGGDNGLNTPFRDEASVIHIFDPSNKPVELENAVNIFSSGKFLDSYDLVVLANVLEHIPFPAETLGELRMYMSKDTVLYVEVPYEKLQADAETNPPYALQGRKLHWHEHINFFSPTSLKTLMSNNGFDIVKSATVNIDCDSVGVSFSAILQMACRLSFE